VQKSVRLVFRFELHATRRAGALLDCECAGMTYGTLELALLPESKGSSIVRSQLRGPSQIARFRPSAACQLRADQRAVFSQF
jgi:hypothetical protein